MQTIDELKNLRAHIDSVINESEARAAQEKKKTLSTYKTKLNLLKSVSKILESCDYSDSGIIDFTKQYYNALTDPDGPREERIYETFMDGLNQYTYLNPVQAELNALKSRVQKDKKNIDMIELLDIMKDSNSFYLVPHIEDVVIEYMDHNTPATRVQLLSAINPYLFDPFVKQIYAMVNSNMTKEQFINESYKTDSTLESLENTGQLIAFDVITPVVALDSTRSAIKLGEKWVILQGRTFTELRAITDVPEEDYLLGKLLDDTDRTFIEANKNEIWYSLSGNTIQSDESPVLIKDRDTIVFEDQSYTVDEFSMINDARIDPIQLVDINNICLIATMFDDIAFLDNTVEYTSPNDSTRSLEVFVTTFNNNVDDSDDSYSLIISDKANSAYEIYNNVPEDELISVLNDTLGTNAVAITESSKETVENKKAEFKKQCKDFECRIAELKKKQNKLKDLYSKFESEEIADSIDSISEDIKKYEDEYSDFQAEFGQSNPDSSSLIGGPTIKDISFQDEVDPEDVDTPLHGEPSDSDDDNLEPVDSLDVQPDDDDFEYAETPGEYDDADDYVNTVDPDTDSDDDFEPFDYSDDDFMSVVSDDPESDSEYDSYTDSETEESVAVYFDSKLGDDNDTESKLSGSVSTAYTAVNVSLGEETSNIITAKFIVNGNTGEPMNDITLLTQTDDTVLPKDVYMNIINAIADTDKYKNFVKIDTAVSSTSDPESLLNDTSLEDTLSDITLDGPVKTDDSVSVDGPIKSLVIEGVCEGKKVSRKITKLNEIQTTGEKIDTAVQAELASREKADPAEYDFKKLDMPEEPEEFEADDGSLKAQLLETQGLKDILVDHNVDVDDLTEYNYSDDEDDSILFDLDYMKITSEADPENDIENSSDSYIFRINWSAPMDEDEEKIYNKPFLISGDHEDAFNFLSDLARGKYDTEDLFDMISADDEESDEDDENVSLYSLDPADYEDDETFKSEIDSVLTDQVYLVNDIEYEDDDEPESLDEAVKLILDKEDEKNDSDSEEDSEEDDILTDEPESSLLSDIDSDSPEDDEDEEDADSEKKNYEEEDSEEK